MKVGPIFAATAWLLSAFEDAPLLMAFGAIGLVSLGVLIGWVVA